jgi:hypothetical protein
LLDELEMI